MKYSYDSDFFEKIDSEAKAYWLGFLYADGYIHRNYKNGKVKSMFLELSLKSEDRAHLEDFLRDIGSNVPIKNKVIKLNGKKYFANRVIISNTKMCRDLVNLGCVPNKSLILTFPTYDMVPKEFMWDFIRGYFDGDGTIYYNNKVRTIKVEMAFVGTQNFLKGINDFLLSEGIPSAFKTHQKGNAFEMYIYGYDNIIMIYDKFYSKATRYLKRKKDKFDEMINFVQSIKYNKSGKRGVYFDARNKQWVAVFVEDGKRKRKNFKSFEEAKEFRVCKEILTKIKGLPS